MTHSQLYAERMEVVKPSAIRQLLKLGADPAVISFGGGFPDPELFPIEKMNKVFESVLLQDGKKALQYSVSEGLPSLREKLAARMKRAGITCGVDNILMTQGGQQGMDLMGKLFLNKGDVVITESPTFLGGLIAFNPMQPQYASVNMDSQGMKMDELEQILKTASNVKFIYTIPEFQNPTGVTMTVERRKQMVVLANKYDVMILEDSPYREIRYEGETLPSIKSFDTEDRVIFLGSFSKILSPGMRLGWMVAEPKIAEKLTLLKMAADTQNSTLNMYAADRFMELYDIDEHIKMLQTAYKAKKDLMLKTIDETFPRDCSYTNPEGGLFTWLTFPEKVDAEWLMRERLLPEAKVAYVPGTGFYAVNPENNHCRVNYSCMSEDKIIAGISKMGAILKECC